jgi:hypothetical protein
LLAAKAPVVGRDEALTGCPRGEPYRASKDRSDAEVRIQPTRASGRLQRSHMNLEFAGQLAERQQLALSLVMSDCGSGAVKHRDRKSSSPAVPRPPGAPPRAGV